MGALPPGMTVSPDGTELTVKDVCKTCQDSSTDLAVFQCNATNDYGYVYANGYMNVIGQYDKLPTLASYRLTYSAVL